MLCFQQLTQLNLVIAVENTPTRASAFNLSDPAVVVNERAVTSRHRNEEYSSNPHFVSGSSSEPNSVFRSGTLSSSVVNYLLVATMSNTARVELVTALVSCDLASHLLDHISKLLRQKLDPAAVP